MRPTPAVGGVGFGGVKALQVGGAAHHEHHVGAFAAARQRHVAVGLVGRDDDIGRGERESLGETRHAVAEAASPELGLVELGHDVVLVEDDPGAVQESVPAGGQEEEVGRVADVDDIEAPGSPDTAGEPELLQSGGGVLARRSP